MTQPSPPPPPEPPDRKEIDRLREEYGLNPGKGQGKLVTSGIEFAGIVVVSILLGLWLDRKFGTKPWILMGLMLLGMVGGMVRLIRRAMKNSV
jgi:F0F1-type ATP synthase assembly protein I